MVIPPFQQLTVLVLSFLSFEPGDKLAAADSAEAAVLSFLAVLGLRRVRLLPCQACRLAEAEEEDLKLSYPFWLSSSSSRNSTHFISSTSIKMLLTPVIRSSFPSLLIHDGSAMEKCPFVGSDGHSAGHPYNLLPSLKCNITKVGFRNELNHSEGNDVSLCYSYRPKSLINCIVVC